MKKIILFCSFILITSLACFVTEVVMPTPAIPTFDENLISTMVIQTARALALSATATNTNTPSETPTSTITFTPTITLAPSRTNTVTLTPLTAAITVSQTANTSPPATKTSVSATFTKPANKTSTGISAVTSTRPTPTNTGIPSATATVATKTPVPPTATPPPTSVDDLYSYVNEYRKLAGIPPVTFDATLNNNCWEHARYMAENDDLTHDQNPALPYASPAGEICAQKGNAFIGSAGYTPRDSIDSWMESPGHRLWLLYPTTPTFGYGFYVSSHDSCAAALDVLSLAKMDLDEGYADWPVRYPAPDQTGVPPVKYAITLNWRYFGSSPVVGATSLKTSDGTELAHTASVDLPAGHKGILISPSADLPANTAITVSVSGTYDGAPFGYTWSFTTGK